MRRTATQKDLTARHGLRGRGVAFTASGCEEGACGEAFGRKLANLYGGVSGGGHGVCRCGAESPHLPSGAARRHWHDVHVFEVGP